MNNSERQSDRLRYEATLRAAIAEALHAEMAYDLPACCDRLGLAPGTSEQAFSSKRTYVKSRLKEFNESALLELGRKVLEIHNDATLRDLVSERLLPADQRLSEITRRAVLKALNRLNELFGEQGRDGLRERLDVLAPSWNRVEISSAPRRSLADDFEQHYIRNDDWDHAYLLEQCGALSCAQDRFITLINGVLRPEARTGTYQEALAETLDAILKPDGYAIDRVGSISGHTIYEVVRRQAGVAGQAKNLIFASTGAKPEIILRDAINNDLQITKNEQLCLIYEQHIPPSAGLTWFSLAEWWKDRERLPDLETARRRLGERLKQSLSSNSPGELALFRTYFEEFLPRLGDKLPALLPQVYLHYDPWTARQRGAEPVLARQRMDFLLLLPDRVRVVLEVDGQHHYAIDGCASPQRYAQMIVEDRHLRLKGYELYRFGGAEFADTDLISSSVVVGRESQAIAKSFFERLFVRHGLIHVGAH